MTGADSSEDSQHAVYLALLGIAAAIFILYTFLMVGWLSDNGIWTEAAVIAFSAGFAVGIGGMSGSYVLSEVVNLARR